MKYFAFLSLTLLVILSGCSRANYIPASTQTVAFNFKVYSANGFMITPEGYTGDYESAGMIAMDIYPEWREEKASIDGLGRRNINDNRVAVTRLVERELTTDEITRHAVDMARGMGANAIIRFHVEPITQDITRPKRLTRNGVRVTGFAIKRIDVL